MLQGDKAPIIRGTCPFSTLNTDFIIVKLYKFASALTIPTFLRRFAVRHFETADSTRQFMDNGSKTMDNMMFMLWMCHDEVTRQSADSD